MRRPFLIFSQFESFSPLAQSDPTFVVCSLPLSARRLPSSSLLLLAHLIVCQHKPIPQRCFPRLRFQVPAWAARLWWWAMCKAAFSNLIKGLRYGPLMQRALEAWRNDSGKSTALICKNLHLLAGSGGGDARRRGRGNGKTSAFRVVALIELQTPNPKLWHPNVLSQTDLAWSRGLREREKEWRNREK